MDETLIVLEKLNQFYSSSFSQLVNMTIGLLAFVGVIIPVLIGLYQNKQFKQEQSHILKALEESKLELIRHIESEVEQRFELERNKRDEEITILKNELMKESQTSKGGVFFVQANNLLKQSCFNSAMESYVDAIHCFIRSENELNAQRALGLLIDNCLPNLLKSDFEHRCNYESKIKDIITQLETMSCNGRYTDLANELFDALEQALKRTEVPELIS